MQKYHFCGIETTSIDYFLIKIGTKKKPLLEVAFLYQEKKINSLQTLKFEFVNLNCFSMCKIHISKMLYR